jgi:hypothetical protein
MKRRDTERAHKYSTEVFNALEIYDIQGLLKEGDKYKCGIEAYQVEDFSLITFGSLNNKEELARFRFCEQLGIPYYIIITSEQSCRYRIYSTINLFGSIKFEIHLEYSENDFLDWWRDKQSFTQRKAMYNAAARIKTSLIDKLLFSNSLAWGVNIDGFSIDIKTGKVNTLYEKRICTYKPPNTINSYDPNRFFHGTINRSGDFPSWDILFKLSQVLNVSLILFTFDTSDSRNVGVSKIIEVTQSIGLTYLNEIKPFNNIIYDNIPGLKDWIKTVL